MINDLEYTFRLNAIFEKVNLRCDYAKYLSTLIGVMTNSGGYDEEVKAFSIVYCKMRVKIFEITLDEVEQLKLELPNLNGHNDLLIQIATWQAELIEARHELAWSLE
jgi:hypothetical protein